MIRRMSSLIVVALIATVLIPGVPSAYAQDMHDHVHVAIDVKPGSDPNAIDINNKGVVPVAVLGSASFKVNDVQAATVRFAPMHNHGEIHQHDAGVLAFKWAFEDVNNDGYTDLVFLFKTREIRDTGLQAGDMQEVCLHGSLMDSQHFCGHDTVKVIG